jgi:Tfp pilus assembly protein PilN
MTQVNLLPSDIREKQRVRRLTALVIMTVGACVALLFLVFVLQASRLSDAKGRLDNQVAVNGDLQNQINDLQEFQALRAEVEQHQALSDAALSGEILWSGVLRDVSMVIPGEMWLTGLTGTLTDTTGAALAAPVTPPATTSPSGTSSSGSSTETTTPTTPVIVSPAAIIGSIQFQGFASDHPTVAKWLVRLEKVNGWVNSWISNATEADANGEAKVQWTGSIDLTTEATVQGRINQ